MSRGLGKLQREIIAALDDDAVRVMRPEWVQTGRVDEDGDPELRLESVPDPDHAGWVDMHAVARLVATRRGHDLEARAAAYRAKWPRMRERQIERYAVPYSLDRSIRRAVSGLVKAGLLDRPWFDRPPHHEWNGSKRFYRRTDKCTAPQRGNA